MNRINIEENLKKLNAQELICRDFYFSEEGHQLSNIHAMDDIKSLLNSSANLHRAINTIFASFDLQEDYISEETFLKVKSDVAVLKHMRYLPAILHSHKFIEIVYVYDGSCTHSTGNVTFDMQKGDICLVAPEVKHQLSVFDDDSIIINLLVRQSTFDTAFFELLSENDILSNFFTRIIYGANKLNPYILFKAGNDNGMKNIILDMLLEYDSSSLYRERMINIYFMLFCTNLLRNHEKNIRVINPLENIQDDNIVPVLRYIQNNFISITFSQVAKLFNYSEAHFSRMIKEYTGRTFSEIIRELRVKKAAELLTNPVITINEIVENVGYTDTSHFYRIFKQYYSMTPMEYRNKNMTAKT